MKTRLLWVLPVAALAAFAQTGEVKTAGEVYKNVQVLKDIPADQLVPSMQFISAALGLECGGCHVQGQMDSDQKGAKKTARQMIAMTMAINKNHFNGRTQVTCETCHRGSERPVSIPPVLESDAAPHPAASGGPGGPPNGGAPQVTADQIIEKYIAAVGGADAMHKVTSREMTGKIMFAGNESPIEVLTKAPNKRVTITKNSSGESYTAYDGTEGWMGNTGRPARAMSPTDSAASAVDAAFYLPLDLKAMYPQLRRGRPETVNGAECDVLQGTAPGKPMVRLDFDRSTGLLVRMVRYTETPMGRMPVQVDYSDYKESDGVKIPMRWTLSRPNGRFTIQIDQVKNNAAIDDSKFAKPEGNVK